MSKKSNFKTALLHSRRFKYGSVAVALTVIFIAVVILLNAVFSVVADYNGGFYLDLTNERIYDISPKTVEVLEKLDHKVEIIFCMTEDLVDDSTELSYVKRLAEKYTMANDNISLIFRDCIKDTVYFNQFKKSSTDTISQRSVIINCPETKRYLVYPYQRFYKLTATSSGTYRIFAYDGENKLTSAITQTALSSTQKAAFVTGHGEEKRSYMETLLREQGYEVSDVDLKNISEAQLADIDLLIISNPKYDYTGISAGYEGRVNEIGVLNNYLTKSFGSLMVFVGPETPALAEFSGFLADDWGVSFTPGDIAVEGAGMALDSYGTYFLGTPSTDGSAGQAVHNAITKEGVTATVFANATPLHLTFTEKDAKTASVVYSTSASSSRYHDGSPVAESSMPVMTLSTYEKVYDNNHYTANVLVSGSVDYMNYVSEQSFSNGDILKSAFALMGNESIVTGIDYKVVEDTAIVVTQDNFKNYTAGLSAIVPILIAVIGVFVYIKRKKA